MNYRMPDSNFSLALKMLSFKLVSETNATYLREISCSESLRGTKQSLSGKHPTLIGYKLRPCNLPFGPHAARSILLLAKLVPRYRSQ